MLCLAILLGSDNRASALNPALEISQYAHTAWTMAKGFFSSRVFSIAQTPDGYLWLGTESGLLRFDGVRIVRWQPRGNERLPSETISTLLVAGDGRLWIGTTAGLASWKEDRLIAYPEFAGQVIASLVEDAQGAVWAGTIGVPHARLCAIGRAVQCVGDDGRFGNGVFSLFDDGGTLWVGAATGLWRWTPDAPARFGMPTPNVNDLTKGADGALLIALAGGVRRMAGQTVDAYAIGGADRALDVRRMLLDRDGGLWLGTSGQGLVHTHQGRTDVFTRSDGLSGDMVTALYEDREGSVWVATNEGLDRFRELAVTTISRKQGLPVDAGASVLSARDGSVWVGTPDGVARWEGGRPTVYGTREGLPDDRIGSLFEDSAGRILVSTLGGIAAFDRGRFVPFPSLPTRVVYGIVQDRAGDFWISDQEQGLIQVGQNATRRIPWSALGHEDHATALVADRTRSGLWLGFYKGGVAFLQDGTVRASFGTAEGLGAGRVSALQLDGDGTLWAATAAGLSRIKDDRIATLTTRNGLPCDAVHWTIADMDRSIWLSMPCGLARISSAELAAWIADPRRPVASTVLDSPDGVRSATLPIGVTPPVARLPDGRLWFATPNGVGVVDPGRLPFNAIQPAVHIEGIVADRKAYGVTSGRGASVDLPPLVRDLQIDYTALSLVAPEKVRFRYRLEGHDDDWQDVGGRRQAFYNDLRPGTYRFRVTASNNSGVWSEAGTFLDVSVAPAFYQTRWFLALSMATVVLLVWGAHRVRLRVVEKHEREITALNERLMKAQEQERMRIAGELHDGVMQEMLAVTMLLGTAKRRIGADSDAKATIEKIQEKMIRVGTDIRRVSHDLHPPALQGAGLPSAIQTYCDEFRTGSGIPVTCEVDEEGRDLSRGAALALFRITQEALGNAAKHAAAKQITVRLTRSDGVVSLEVSDDGVGFDRSRLASSGGLGLITMRERAGQLNGTFDFETAPGRGTTIRVLIPFR